MWLELKKVKMAVYVRGALLSNLILMGIIASVVFTSIPELDIDSRSYVFLFSMVDSLVKSIFIVFSAVLLSKFVIDEYKNKTMMLMFMYPINRKKLMISKLLIVMSFTFAAIVLSNAFLDVFIVFLNKFVGLSNESLTPALISGAALNALVSGITSMGMGLIPLFFGMRKKSVPATIVSSVILISIIGSGSNGFTLSSIIYIPITLSIIGCIIAYSTFRNIENIDLAD